MYGENSRGDGDGMLPWLHAERGAGVWIIDDLEAQLVTSVTRTVSVIEPQ